jgi:hypothetical protein
MTSEEANDAIKRWEERTGRIVDCAPSTRKALCEFFAVCVTEGKEVIPPADKPRKVAGRIDHGAGA